MNNEGSLRRVVVKKYLVGDIRNLDFSYRTLYDLDHYQVIPNTPFPSDFDLGNKWIEHIYTKERILGCENWIRKEFKNYKEAREFLTETTSKFKYPGNYNFDVNNEVDGYGELLDKLEAFGKVFHFDSQEEWDIFITKYLLERDLYHSPTFAKTRKIIVDYYIFIRDRYNSRRSEFRSLKYNTNYVERASGYNIQELERSYYTFDKLFWLVDKIYDQVQERYSREEAEREELAKERWYNYFFHIEDEPEEELDDEELEEGEVAE